MKTDAGLLEIFGRIGRVARLDSQRGPSANPIRKFVALVHFLETEEWQEFPIEFNGSRKTCHREIHVGHTVDLNHVRSALILPLWIFWTGMETRRPAHL